MPKSLTFKTGIVEYDINGVKASFNPTDETFVHRLYVAFKSLGDLQGSFETGEDFSGFMALDKQMREVVDGVLGAGMSDALFPDMNCYALADGLPVWMNLMVALLDEVQEAYEREFGKYDARTESLREKYGGMMAKYRKGKK